MWSYSSRHHLKPGDIRAIHCGAGADWLLGRCWGARPLVRGGELARCGSGDAGEIAGGVGLIGVTQHRGDSGQGSLRGAQALRGFLETASKHHDYLSGVT